MFLLNILLAVTWGMATGTFSVPNLAFGFAVGYLILRFSQRVLGPSPYFARVPLAIGFILRYLWDLILANFRVAYDVLVPGAWPDPVAGRGKVSPRPSPGAARTGGTAPAVPASLRAPIAAESYVCPGVVAIPLDARTDAEIALLANLITLTPGSVTLDLSEDRRVLYVHAMYIDGGDVEAYVRSVKEGLERRVLELLR
jgi:multicomponent Na+:H+ antiporter subunit E